MFTDVSNVEVKQMEEMETLRELAGNGKRQRKSLSKSDDDEEVSLSPIGMPLQNPRRREEGSESGDVESTDISEELEEESGEEGKASSTVTPTLVETGKPGVGGNNPPTPPTNPQKSLQRQPPVLMINSQTNR